MTHDNVYRIVVYMNQRFFVSLSMIDIYVCMGLQESEAYLFHDRGPYHIEICPLIYRANQWTDYYMTETCVMKELINALINNARKFFQLPCFPRCSSSHTEKLFFNQYK